MEGQYGAVLEGQTAGKVHITRQGLYYEILCRCELPEDRVFRLLARWEGGEQNIGVLIPEEKGCFYLKKRIAVRHIPQEKVTFQIVRHTGVSGGTFIPIRPDEPFAYIRRLNTSFLEFQKGQPGIRLQKTPGTDL